MAMAARRRDSSGHGRIAQVAPSGSGAAWLGEWRVNTNDHIYIAWGRLLIR
jgi:hypothetical protein